MAPEQLRELAEAIEDSNKFFWFYVEYAMCDCSRMKNANSEQWLEYLYTKLCLTAQ